MIENNILEKYKLKVVYRGEGLFYHDLEHDKAFICDIQIRNGSIFEKSIKIWDDGSKVENKTEILNRIKRYFETYQKIKPVIR